MGATRAGQGGRLRLHGNPRPGEIPWHRVVNRCGEVSKAFAFGGENRQILLLLGEGVEFLPDGRVDLKTYGWFADG